jgi:CRISPR system Cascade subunit CasE
MILSQAKFPVTHRKWQVFLSNPYVQHRELAACFDGDVRFLYRVEPENSEGLATVIIQSHVEPNWSNCALLSELPPNLRRSKYVQLGIQAGMLLRFRLRANPTVKRRGKRHSVKGLPELTEWLQGKLSHIGCQLQGALVIQEGTVRASRPGQSGSGTMTFSSVRFEGTLQADDPDSLKVGLDSGIGSAKAFGFGLLSIARV